MPEDIKYYKCEKCNYKTLKSSFLSRHMAKHEKRNKPKKFITCTECDYKTWKLSNFKRHQLKHNNVRKFLCIICGLGFKRSDTLKQHLATHAQNESIDNSGNGSTFPVCDICQKTCRSSTHLREHMMVHSNERSVACNFCDMTFKSNAYYLKHKKSVHSSSKLRFQCAYCPQKVSTNQNLVRHIKTFHEKSPRDDFEDEPVIYTLDLTQENPSYNLNSYLINESGSLIIPANSEFSTDLK